MNSIAKVKSCPNCGSNNVELQLVQKEQEGVTITKKQSKYKQKGHGLLWWLFIGWWWWIIDLCLWIFLFPLRLIAQLLKKKKYTEKSTSVVTTKTKVVCASVGFCKDCGHHWET